jgi:hypothetical protein
MCAQMRRRALQGQSAGSVVTAMLAAHPILLVIEREGCSREQAHVQAIQRRVQGGYFVVINGEGDVAEAKGGDSSFPRAVKAFGWAQKPVECDDAEVADSLLFGIGQVECGVQVA